jgi:hypothetical protein
MINYLDETLRELFTRIDGDIVSGFQVSFELPDEEFRSQVKTQGTNILNVCLVDLRENRSSSATAASKPSSDAGGQREYRRIDCHYLISAWSPAARTMEPTLDEHALLYKAMTTLMEAEPLVPAGVYRAKPLPSDFPAALRNAALPTMLLPVERFPKIAEFWSAGRGHWKPTLHLVVTLPVLPAAANLPLSSTKKESHQDAR